MAYTRDENGNLKKTVRCSYCYGTGHSRRTCPELHPNGTPAQQRAKLREEAKEHRKLVRAQRKRDKAAGKEVTKITRKCGYCGEKGHTRRTCVHRKNKVAEELDKILDIRQRVAERMMDRGFGPGALISVDSPSDHGESVMAIVTKIDFSRIESRHMVNKDEYFYGTDCVLYNYVVPQKDTWSDTPKVTGYCYVPLEYLNIDDIHENEWYRTPSNRSCTLLSPVDVSEDSLLTEDSFGDKKKVENWVIKNIVDPR